jgi:hypothetical protein
MCLLIHNCDGVGHMHAHKIDTLGFECGLETLKFHKIFILYNIMPIVPHAPNIY